MIKINRKLEYGLMALKHMRAKRLGELSTAKEIGEVYQAPFDVVAKVLQQLAHHGWLKVAYGVKGGYVLQRDLQTVSLLDLTEILLGPVQLVDCLSGETHDCTLSPSCNVADPLKKLNSKVKDFYKQITIAELVGQTQLNADNSPPSFVV